MRYKLEVTADSNGELILEFPDELMDNVGWQGGDTLLCQQQENGDWLISKKETTISEDNDNEY